MKSDRATAGLDAAGHPAERESAPHGCQVVPGCTSIGSCTHPTPGSPASPVLEAHRCVFGMWARRAEMSEDFRAPSREHDGYIVRELAAELRFDEHSPFRMIYVWTGQIETLREIRFFERRRGWTGKGIEASPRIQAKIGDRDLNARRHGPFYREGGYEFFHVDFRERVPAGTRVEVVTESLYVDEEGTFDPFLRAVSHEGLEKLTLLVTTRIPIDCAYEFGEGATAVREPVDPVQQETQGDPTYSYSVTKDLPQQGSHALIWSWGSGNV